MSGWRDPAGYGRWAVPGARARGSRDELAEFLDSGQAGQVVVGNADMGAMIERER